MPPSESELLGILMIGHDSSMRGSGISVLQALRERHYRELRPGFGVSDLLAILRAKPYLIEHWLDYSADKRTDGWFVLADGVVGRHVGSRRETERFASAEEAVAHFVVRELDMASSHQGPVMTVRLMLWLAWGAVVATASKLKGLIVAEKGGRSKRHAG